MIGRKTRQGQKFLENGRRIPVTYIDVSGVVAVDVKKSEKNNYFAIQMGAGRKRKANKTLLGHAKRASLSEAPNFLKEVRLRDDESQSLPSLGDKMNALDFFKPGDVVNITGTSKGKGFAGVVKRHGFHGGPKTHGQSDRHRAPGAIGQGTTPGRVYKGKRMAGRMGHDQVTIKNLKIIEVSDKEVLIAGLVPGVLGSYIVIKKIGEDKKFVPLYKEPVAADEAPVSENLENQNISEAEVQSVNPEEKIATVSVEAAEEKPTEEVNETPDKSLVSEKGDENAGK